MGFDLQPIRAATKTITVEWDLTDPPQTLELTYLPAIITPEIEDQITEAAKNDQEDILLEMLLFMLRDWTILDPDDPAKQAYLSLDDKAKIKKHVPSMVIRWLLEKIGEDRSPKAKKPVALRRGSLLAGSGDTRQAGTQPV